MSVTNLYMIGRSGVATWTTHGRSCISSQLGLDSALSWSFPNTPFPPLKAGFQWFLCRTPGTSVCREESEGCPPSVHPKGAPSINTQSGHPCTMSSLFKYHLSECGHCVLLFKCGLRVHLGSMSSFFKVLYFLLEAFQRAGEIA